MLNKIINPIPMYARKARIEIPKTDEPIGFDLIEYAWVAPYGKGKRADLVFKSHRRWKSRLDFDLTLDLAFANPGDGLIAVPVNGTVRCSGPHMSVTAPLDGYMQNLSRGLTNMPGIGRKDDSLDQNYYIRVRTVSDPQGNLQSALYGKIYGDFMLDPINSKTTLILFTYYLNPAPNDRKVEFDPNQNPFRSLGPLDKVSEP